MEARTRAAAAAASLIPFSCCCCFEEFNLADRPPMVLPCGHTYVCAPCVRRLSRCMECREPLFLSGVVAAPPKPAPGGSGGGGAAPAHSYNRDRYSPQPPEAPQPRPPTAERVMLPIPKNLVLISMMEAAQRQVALDRAGAAAAASASDDLSAATSEEDPDDDDGAGDEDEEYNLDKIISGMATLSGPCGTYAVKNDNELCVVAVDPRKASGKDGEEKKTEDSDAAENLPLPLHSGQTLQVVSFDDGVAKLARGAGYVVASTSQLVKVGGPREASCRLEGLLETIESRGRDLEATLDENRQIEKSLRQQIEDALSTEPDYPIIAEAALTDPGQENSSPSHHANGYLQTPTGTPVRGQGTPGSTETHAGMRIEERLVSGMAPVYPSSPASPNSIDNSDIAGGLGLGIPAYRRSDNDDEMEDTTFGCGTTSFLVTGTTLFGSHASNYAAGGTSLLPSSPDPDLHHHQSSRHAPGVLHSSRDDPFAHSMPTLTTSSFDAVDFRTGLSGHRGLTNVRKSGTNATPRGTGRVMRMSEHRGIGRINVRQHSPTSSPSPAQSGFH